MVNDIQKRMLYQAEDGEKSDNPSKETKEKKRFFPNVQTRRRRNVAPLPSSHQIDLGQPDMMGMERTERKEKKERKQREEKKERKEKKDRREKKLRHRKPTRVQKTIIKEETVGRSRDLPEVIESDEELRVKDEVKKKEADNSFGSVFKDVLEPPLTIDSFQESNDEKNMNSLTNRQDQLFFIQLPSHLPMKTKVQRGKTEHKTMDEELESIWTSDYENSLSHIQAGRIGQMKIHKSGKMVLVVDTDDGSQVSFNVVPGVKHGFQEDLVSIEGNDCYMLGSISQSINCIPNVEEVIKK